MVRRQKEKVSALVYVAAALLLFLLPHDVHTVGLSAGSGPWTRLTYMLYHANVLHLAVNCYALVVIVFTYRVTVPMLLWSVAIAASVPACLLPDAMVTVGVSGAIYALLGRVCTQVTRKVYYHSWMAFFIGIGFLFPHTNAVLHLYCYVLGVALAYLNEPVQWRR